MAGRPDGLRKSDKMMNANAKNPFRRMPKTLSGVGLAPGQDLGSNFKPKPSQLQRALATMAHKKDDAMELIACLFVIYIYIFQSELRWMQDASCLELEGWWLQSEYRWMQCVCKRSIAESANEIALYYIHGWAVFAGWLSSLVARQSGAPVFNQATTRTHSERSITISQPSVVAIH